MASNLGPGRLKNLVRVCASLYRRAGQDCVTGQRTSPLDGTGAPPGIMLHGFWASGFRPLLSNRDRPPSIRRRMSTSGDHLQSDGGGRSGRGGAGSWSSSSEKKSWFSYWPLGMASLTAIMTAQAAGGIDADKTYEQLAVQLSKPLDAEKKVEGYIGGLSSLIHWLHLFGSGPAGQELRRRLAKSGCVEAVIGQEEAWNAKVVAGMSKLSSPALGASRETKSAVVQAYWMRETCLLAISELLQGCDAVADIFFESDMGILARVITPPRDSATEIIQKLVHDAGFKRAGKLPARGAVLPGSDSIDPLSAQMSNQDFGSISKSLPDTAWGDEGSIKYQGAPETLNEDSDVGQGSRRWSVSQVRVLQVLARDPRLASLIAGNADAVACFAENLDAPKEQKIGFIRVIELDTQRRVLKCLCDVAKHLGGNVRAFEDAHLQERLMALSRDKDVVIKALATQAIKELTDVGATFPSDEQGWSSQEGKTQITAIATEEDLKPTSRQVHYGRLIWHLPVAIACGTFWGTSKEYAKLRKRTVVALPNLIQTAAKVGVRTGLGAAATYFCTVHMMKMLHHSTTVNCQTPSEVVNTAGGAIAGEFGLIWVMSTLFPYSFGGFIFSNLVLAQLASISPSLFGPVLVSSQVREKR